jgi:hypothetical protein
MLNRPAIIEKKLQLTFAEFVLLGKIAMLPRLIWQDRSMSPKVAYIDLLQAIRSSDLPSPTCLSDVIRILDDQRFRFDTSARYFCADIWSAHEEAVDALEEDAQ